jgi:hypothetical protein
MLDSIQLSLLMGPVNPVPVPRMVLDSLASVEVTVKDMETTGFQLIFSIDKNSPLQLLFLITGGTPLLFMRVVLVTTVNGIANVLIDGVITKNDIAPGDKGSNSTLTLTGEDLTALMNQSDLSGFPFPACTAEMRVAQLLSKYAVFGVVPLVIPSVMSYEPLPTSQTPSQKGTDLAYIRALAKQAGFVFYLDPGPVPGMTRAYWGPQVKVGLVQPPLSADMDAYTNVESLTFAFNQQQNRKPTVYSFSDQSGSSGSIPIPGIGILNPPLGAIAPLPTNIMGDLRPPWDDAAKKPVPEVIMQGLASAAQFAEAITGQGTLDVTRYGGVLQARQLVGVRGAGFAFDGLYYVKSVTHHIKRGEYKQDFNLSRDGLASTVPSLLLS